MSWCCLLSRVWWFGTGVGSVGGSFCSGLSGCQSDPPGAPGRHFCGFSSFFGSGGTGNAQEYPAPVNSCVSRSGEPVTGRTTVDQHEIEINDARPVRCGPHRLALAGLRISRKCLRVVRLSPAIVLGLLLWYWWRKRMGLHLFVLTTAGWTHWRWRMLTPFLVLMTHCVCWETNSGFPLWTWPVDTGKWSCQQKLNERLPLYYTRDFINSRWCNLDFVMLRRLLRDLWTECYVTCVGRAAWYTWTM